MDVALMNACAWASSSSAGLLRRRWRQRRGARSPNCRLSLSGSASILNDVCGKSVLADIVLMLSGLDHAACYHISRLIPIWFCLL
jgi:hypothetical protein